MTSSHPARTKPRPIRGLLVTGFLVVIVAIAAALAFPVLAPSSTTAGSPPGVPRREHRDTTDAAGHSAGEAGDSTGATDGALPDGTTPFGDEIPGVRNLDPSLLAALRRAAADATDDGVQILVTSGWRSAAYQERLLHEAVSRYGSRKEAARWVATPETSAHVSGDAVDIGPVEATVWLSRHGVAYGLCPVYRNEPWHFELRPRARDHGCPRMYADPAHDPRMQP
jgi:hypothetical protein